VGSHPANLALRFVLELAALFGLGWWGWSLTDGWARFALAGLFVVGAAGIWGTFAVPDDPSRSGGAPVPVRGWIRLLIELLVFCGGVIGLTAGEQAPIGIALLIGVVIHYLLSLDRIRWLLER